MGRLDEARNAFRSVLALEPNNVDARINLAIALSRLNFEKEALAQFDAVLRAAPGHVEALYNRATLLSVMGRFEEAVSDCKKVLITSPDFDYALGTYVWSKLQCCDWNGIDEARSRIESGLAAGKKVLNPQQYVGIATSSESLLRCARLWVANEYPPDASPLWRGERYDHERIRVGYLSADFHAHATAYLMAGIFENHDRSSFETIAVSHGPNDGGAMRQRLEGAFDRFVAAEEKSDAEIARLIRESEIDILVDLKGYTQGARTAVLAQRPAPLQISYLGYPGTTGAGYID
jgi:predicted O-linked N-acetylglucosamine transferase (SPINDLY family)